MVRNDEEEKNKVQVKKRNTAQLIVGIVCGLLFLAFIVLVFIKKFSGS